MQIMLDYRLIVKLGLRHAFFTVSVSTWCNKKDILLRIVDEHISIQSEIVHKCWDKTSFLSHNVLVR